MRNLLYHVHYEDRADIIAALESYRELFPPAIQRRWSAYLSSPDRRKSIVSKVLLYMALMHEFPGAVPGKYPLRYDAKGRPFITSKEQFDFNISHSRDLIACAISFRGRLGLDVHHRAERRNFEKYRKSLDRIIDLGRPLQLEDWVSMEAILKCRGEGLSGLKNIMQYFDEHHLQAFDLHPDYLCRVASTHRLEFLARSFQIPVLIDSIEEQLDKSTEHVSG
ncbi:MAG: hypothetical protein AAFN92_22920 [Bacteroidota bacterium]